MVPVAIQVLIAVIIGVLIVGFLPLIHWNHDKPEHEGHKQKLALKAPGMIARQKARKEENKQKILGMFGTMPEGRLTNFDVELILGFKETTAARYLDELEKQGKIRKVITVGRQAYYEKVL